MKRSNSESGELTNSERYEYLKNVRLNCIDSEYLQLVKDFEKFYPDQSHVLCALLQDSTDATKTTINEKFQLMSQTNNSNKRMCS